MSWARRSELETATLGGHFAERNTAMASATWDIVHLAPPSRPGEFRMWVLVDRQLHALRMHVPRQVYVNFIRPPKPGMLRDTYVAESVYRTLPRGASPRHLMRLTIPERVSVARASQ